MVMAEDVKMSLQSIYLLLELLKFESVFSSSLSCHGY